ncbi:cyclic nucleotide-binding domain-containing protein [Grimontia hollisae]|uniref:Cyclic nucleotide-binding domain (CNMP-BD) protein n=1 Tax=Grimontia hollisae CIP 101886 TaxID=675812 RepID=D0IAF9_GRIHO|nr:cyclic nucleotide-binding domain-containing protein [Grimontia hollisae]AMG31849.1 cyclic nucleotide-binding domain-containing protein [Grimontia hollisae]EEY70877.1 cyclic nucleotide-binding domain (cNMP-BD) protein [Grimontia hollisae CIP 101886]STO44625.1 DNA-binding transcriptional dual regulator Crp [Grimontia hollisae]
MNKPDQTNIVRLIMEAPIGQYIGEDGAKVLAQQAATEITLQDGEFLYRVGDAANSFYIVNSGRLAMCRENKNTGKINLLHTLHQGDLIGELSFIDGEPRSISVQALGVSSVLCFNREDIDPLITTHPTLVFDFMRAVVKRVHHTVTAIGQQQAELADYIATGGKGRF